MTRHLLPPATHTRSRGPACHGTLLATALALLLTLVLALPAQARTPRTRSTPVAPVLPVSSTGQSWDYTIVRGDTLIGIAARQLIEPGDWRALQRLNQVRNPRRLVPGSVLHIPLAWMRRSETVATVVFVQGRATRSGAGGAEQVLAIGDTVHAQDALHTDADATLTLRFANGSRLLVAPSSDLAVEHLLAIGTAALPDIRLRLQQGRTEVKITPAPVGRSFEIRTPAVNLGVRGTEFRARVAPGGAVTHVEVLHGRVSASGGADVGASAGTRAGTPATPLNAGQGAVAERGGRIGLPQPLPAAPTLDGLPERLERVPLRLAWATTPGAAGYHAQVFAAGDSEFSQLLLDGSFPAAAARWSDLPDGHYTLRVRALDAQGLEGVDSQRSFVLKARPVPPFTSTPAAGAKVYGDSARFSWTGVPAAQRYHLQVARTPDFSAPVFDSRDVNGTQHTLALEPGRYHWRVGSIARIADGHDDDGPLGDAQAFTQRRVPPSPVQAAPQTGPDGITLRWQQPERGQKVHVQVARDSAFQQLVLDQSTERADALLPAPAAGTYFVRVKTIDADGFEGPFGPAQTLEVPHSRWWLLLPLGLVLLAL